MIRILPCIALAAAGWLAPPAPAHAAQSYDNCTGFISSLPATITTQGTWCLNKDVTTSVTSGNAITIATNNVTLDCNHFKIGGLGAGTGTTAKGIFAASRLNLTVRNCNIRGFLQGVMFGAGGGHLVENNSFDGNTFASVQIGSPGSTIRRNLVIDTGGSSAPPYRDQAFGIYALYGVDILGNTINGVAPTDPDAWAYGIYTHDNGEGSIRGNRVRGLAGAGMGAPYGIYTHFSGRGIIRDNDVQGPGPGGTGGIGISCDTNTATARDNVIAGFQTGIVNCLSSGNAENPN